MADISVIIPTFNRARMIGQTLSSVLRQEIVDLEVLVVDDGSEDDTKSVVQEIDDIRIKYIHQRHSGLPAVGRNAGISQAKGKYIAFLDSDDLWMDGKLCRQVAFMEENPDLGLSYTNALQFTDDPSECDPRPVVDKGKEMSGRVFERLYGKQVIPNLTVMIRSSVVDEIGFLNEDPRLKGNEDYEYWLRIARLFPFGYINEPLAKYRHHPGGISKSGSSGFFSKLYLIEHLDRLFPDIKTNLRHERKEWKSEVNHHLSLALYREKKYSQSIQHVAKSCWLDPLSFLSRSKEYTYRR